MLIPRSDYIVCSGYFSLACIRGVFSSQQLLYLLLAQVLNVTELMPYLFIGSPLKQHKVQSSWVLWVCICLYYALSLLSDFNCGLKSWNQYTYRILVFSINIANITWYYMVNIIYSWYVSQSVDILKPWFQHIACLHNVNLLVILCIVIHELSTIWTTHHQIKPIQSKCISNTHNY